MSISKTTEYVNEMVAEVEQATDCERIQTFIDEHVATVTDTIKAQGDEMSELLSQWAPLVSLPSDPLKILKWASKVVGGPIAAQVAAIAQLAIEMAQLASALAGLASAVAGAAQKLANCLEDALIGALTEIQNTLIDEATALLDQAEGIANQLIEDFKDSSGITELENAIASLEGDINSIESSLATIEDAADPDNLPDPGI